MAHQPTCGQGLAEHSVLPAKVGELTAAVAGILDTHVTALTGDDASTRQERDAYQRLVHEHRAAAAALVAIGEAMAGYRNLPMGKHGETAMSSPRAVEAFQRFVKCEQELLALLQSRVEADAQMLVEMGGSTEGRPAR